MRCPLCKNELAFFGVKRVETLDEHVFNPNGDGSDQDTVICRTPNCLARDLVFYDESGDLYVEDYDRFRTLALELQGELGKGALNSIARDFNEKLAWERRRTFRPRLGRYMLVFGLYDHWYCSFCLDSVQKGLVFLNPIHQFRYWSERRCRNQVIVKEVGNGR